MPTQNTALYCPEYVTHFPTMPLSHQPGSKAFIDNMAAVLDLGLKNIVI